jgi:hypothetical protein
MKINLLNAHEFRTEGVKRRVKRFTELQTWIKVSEMAAVALQKKQVGIRDNAYMSKEEINALYEYIKKLERKIKNLE